MSDSESHTVISWSAYEHEHIVRSADWMWALGISAVSLAAICILFNDFLFGLLILIAAFTIALLARTPPPLTEFTVSEDGVQVGSTMHRFSEILSFWIDDKHPSGRTFLLIDTVKFMAPNLIIPIESVEHKDVRTLLLKHVKEVPMKEPVSHKIFEFLGL